MIPKSGNRFWAENQHQIRLESAQIITITDDVDYVEELLISLMQFAPQVKGRTLMLNNCIALASAGDNDWTKRMRRLLRQAGFNQCKPYTGANAVNPVGPPSFVFLHDGLDRANITTKIRNLRQHRSPEVRFTPVVMITRDSSQAAILGFMGMGFDDIVLYPCQPTMMARRLRLQIEKPQHYFQTETYFGPDRRRGLPQQMNQEKRTAEHDGYCHMIIQRQMSGGTKILSSTETAPTRVEEDHDDMALL